ncbi:hypothetical protein AMTR_s00086p00160300 [Amborella trichopoda]|uniref:Major facilitator superfamily (MFS) profile domain-containing protein n=2 Tax=Amborella trichopoda TaxID=13333 RepID=W1P5H2_AMBTC|nr:hypothetical protein AMTR_s00086p00160300 [Amborella trichopoda]
MADETDVLNDAWDYKGRPAKRSTTGGWLSAASILGVELVERLTTLGIAVNLVTYLTNTMHLRSAYAANSVTNFLGTSFMLCLLGGFIADSFLGRYRTIAIFAAVQALGVTLLTISTVIPALRPPPCNEGGRCVPASTLQLSMLFLALYLTALGTGGLKSSVSGFGSDQFDESVANEKAQMMRFFQWFFFFITLGALGAVTVLVYIQDNIGRRWGYGTCVCAMVVALAVYLSGTRRYRFKKLASSPLTQIARVLFASWKNRHLELPLDPMALCQENFSEMKKPRFIHTKQFRFLDKAAILEPNLGLPERPTNPWKQCSLMDVEEVKMVIKMLPIWATTIMFWTVYAQMTTFSVQQAMTMRRHIVGGFSIPSASLTLFFVVSILLIVPLYDRVIRPLSRRITGHPQGFSPLQRIACGLILSVLAMVAAALTEIKRVHAAHPSSSVVPLSVFWLVPQFVLVGVGEALTYVGQLDFFLKECPQGMKSMSTGMFLSTLSLGFFFSSILVSVVDKLTTHGSSGGGWIADDLNKGRLYDFYWLLGILSFLNLGVFFFCARGYVYNDARMAEEDEMKCLDNMHEEL